MEAVNFRFTLLYIFLAVVFGESSTSIELGKPFFIELTENSTGFYSCDCNNDAQRINLIASDMTGHPEFSFTIDDDTSGQSLQADAPQEYASKSIFMTVTPSDLPRSENRRCNVKVSTVKQSSFVLLVEEITSGFQMHVDYPLSLTTISEKTTITISPHPELIKGPFYASVWYLNEDSSATLDSQIRLVQDGTVIAEVSGERKSDSELVATVPVLRSNNSIDVEVSSQKGSRILLSLTTSNDINVIPTVNWTSEENFELEEYGMTRRHKLFFSTPTLMKLKISTCKGDFEAGLTRSYQSLKSRYFNSSQDSEGYYGFAEFQMRHPGVYYLEIRVLSGDLDYQIEFYDSKYDIFPGKGGKLNFDVVSETSMMMRWKLPKTNDYKLNSGRIVYTDRHSWERKCGNFATACGISRYPLEGDQSIEIDPIDNELWVMDIPHGHHLKFNIIMEVEHEKLGKRQLVYKMAKLKHYLDDDDDDGVEIVAVIVWVALVAACGSFLVAVAYYRKYLTTNKRLAIELGEVRGRTPTLQSLSGFSYNRSRLSDEDV